MKVLIATDGSEFAQAAINAVAERSWPEKTELMVLHVVPELSPAYIGFNYGYAEALARVHDAGRQSGKRIVNDAVDALADSLPELPITGSICDGNAAHGIVEAAKQWGADLIVLGSHGRTGLARFFLGSVAEAVVRLAPCSVEVIRTRHKDTKSHEQRAAG